MNYKDIYTQYMYSYPHKKTYDFAEKLDISDYKNSFVNKDMGLYIHIPFCRAKCGYCNLFSITNIKKENYKDYIKAVKRHSSQMKEHINFENTNFNSLILGGGTPMILSNEELEDIFSFVSKEYNINLDTVFSVIESSPKEITKEKLDFLKEYKLKRISIGVQSFVERELLSIERAEKIGDIYRALELVKKYDFEFSNIDLIYGIPNQDEKSLIYSINEALKFDVNEVFLYPLYKQKNARLYDKFEIDYKKQYELYKIGSQLLIDRGYKQLSMRSFSKNKNLQADCGFENTLSLGCGGRSYFENLHFCEKYVSEKKECENKYFEYINRKDFLSDISFYLLNEDEMKRRYAIKNILYITGLNKIHYENMFKVDVKDDFSFIENLIEKGYLYEDESRIYLTKEGIGLSDMIGPMFMSNKIRERMNL